MNFTFPYIVSATDIRYKFKSIAEKIRKTGKPAIIVDNSKPIATLHPYQESQTYSLQIAGDPNKIYETRRKIAPYVKGWDVVAEIRKMRSKS